MIKKIIGYLGFYFLNKMDLRLLFAPVGNPIEAARQFFLRLAGAQIGTGSYIRANAKISGIRHLKIGRNSKINNEARLYLFADVTIGDNVEIGPEFLIYNAEHNIADKEQPLTKQGSFHQPVIIGDDVYIGARVTVLKGSVIESRTVIGANALVAGRLESGFIYGGVPARKIRPL